jgi:hypothetical protein
MTGRGRHSGMKQNVLMEDKGVVLVIALLMLLVMTLLGISSISSSVFETNISGNDRVGADAFYAAEACGIGPASLYEPYNPNQGWGRILLLEWRAQRQKQPERPSILWIASEGGVRCIVDIQTVPDQCRWRILRCREGNRGSGEHGSFQCRDRVQQLTAR